MFAIDLGDHLQAAGTQGFLCSLHPLHDAGCRLLTGDDGYRSARIKVGAQIFATQAATGHVVGADEGQLVGPGGVAVDDEHRDAGFLGPVKGGVEGRGVGGRNDQCFGADGDGIFNLGDLGVDVRL